MVEVGEKVDNMQVTGKFHEKCSKKGQSSNGLKQGRPYPLPLGADNVVFPQLCTHPQGVTRCKVNTALMFSQWGANKHFLKTILGNFSQRFRLNECHVC